MRTKLLLLLIGLIFCTVVEAQVKIGDNPQTINVTSLLELESATRALVITRISTAQMTAMTPSQGAVIYNTDTQCLHYFSGGGWVNLCEALEEGKTFTADASVNPIPTIVITETGNNLNFEVGQITGSNIVNGSINGAVDIQEGSVTRNNLALNSVGRDQLEDGAVSEADIDLDEVTLGTFTNDAGYITGATIISPTAGNVLTNDNGAYYSDTTLQTAIADNAADLDAHIVADGDLDATNEIQNLAEVLTEGNAANNSITNLTNPTNPQDAATKFYVDNAITGAVQTVVSGDANNSITPGTDNGAFFNAAPLQAGIAANTAGLAAHVAADGDLDDENELTDLAFDPATNILSLTNPASGPGGAIDLSALAGGGGSTEVADGTTITGVGTIADPFKIEPSATPGQFLRTELVTGNVIWDDLPAGAGGAVSSDGITIVGDGVATNLSVPTGGITTTQILDATIIADDIANDAVTTLKIVDANVTQAKIAPGAADQILRTNGTGTLVEWVDLPNATGTTELADQATIVGTGIVGDEFQVADGGITTTQILDGTIGADDIANDAVTTLKILNANVTPLKLEPGAIGTILSTDAAGEVAWLTPLSNGTTELADQITITGNGALGNEFEVADGGITSLQIADDTILEEDIADDAITTDKIADENVTPIKLQPGTSGQFLSTNLAGDVEWTAVTPGSVIGTPNSIFFGNASGLPITAEQTGLPLNQGALYWDPIAKSSSGALFVGLDPSFTKSDRAKVVIAERNSGLAFPLQLINDDGGNSGAGILFTTGTDGGTFTHGKGALVYERTASRSRGDFHFLQNSVIGDANTVLADAVMTIRNNGNVIVGPISRTIPAAQRFHVEGDMRLTGSFFDSTPSAGTAGQILSSTGTGTEWINIAGTGLIQNASGALEVDPASIVGNGDITSTELAVGGDTNALLGDVTLAILDDAVTAAKLNPDVAGTGLIQNASGALEVDPASIVGNGDITSTELAVGGDTNALLGDVTLAILDDAVTAAKLNPDVAGTGLIQNASGALEVDPASIVGNGDITSTELAVGGDTNALLGDVTLAILDDAVTAAKLNPDVAGTGLIQNASGALEVDPASIVGNGDITSTELAVGGDTNALLGDVTLAILDDAVTAAKLNPDVAGTGLIQNASGALEVDPASIVGNGDITSTELAVGGDTNALLGDVTLAILDDAVTAAKLNPDVAGTGLIQNASGALEVDPASIVGNGDITSTELAVGGDTNALLGDVTLAILDDAVTAAKLNPDVAGTGLIQNASGALEVESDIMDLQDAIQVDGAQNVGIGIAPAERLHVDGNILATGTITPDYVFQSYFDGISALKPDYKMMSLKEIEAFAKTNKHLPGVPSAKEVSEKGGIIINRATEINLEKIEELFLHTIHQEKEIEKLKQSNEILATELDALKKDLAEIKKALSKE